MKKPKQKKEPDKHWPFPPASGPVPWTKKQVREYKQKQLDELPESLF